MLHEFYFILCRRMKNLSFMIFLSDQFLLFCGVLVLQSALNQTLLMMIYSIFLLMTQMNLTGMLCFWFPYYCMNDDLSFFVWLACYVFLCSWESGQILARKLMIGLVADYQQNKALSLSSKFVEGFRSILSDSSLDKVSVCLCNFIMWVILITVAW